MKINKFFKKAIITTFFTSGLASFAFADRGGKNHYKCMGGEHFKRGYHQEMRGDYERSHLKKETSFIKEALLPASSFLKKAYHETREEVIMEVTGESIRDFMKERRTFTKEEQQKYSQLFEEKFNTYIDKGVEQQTLTQQQATRAKERIKDYLMYSHMGQFQMYSQMGQFQRRY